MIYSRFEIMMLKYVYVEVVELIIRDMRYDRDWGLFRGVGIKGKKRYGILLLCSYGRGFRIVWGWIILGENTNHSTFTIIIIITLV